MITSFLIIIFTAPLQFIYWMKWIVSYAAIRLNKKFRYRRFELYDVTAKNDPYKSGLLVPKEEKRLESPFSDSHLLEAVDEVYFFGVNSKSECILVRIARIYNQMADAWIYLKMANGKTYNLRETLGYQESLDGKTFSCGKLQMHYLLPMRRWRIFYCGMLNETSKNKENEESVFVKFIFLWKASSEAYDCALDTNSTGFASALAKADWKGSFKPPVDKLITPSNFYAQTGIMAGTVSINDGEDYEMYLFGEKVRNLAKITDITECKCVTILGNTPTIGLNFHLSTMSMKNSFEDLHIGFVVDPDGEMEYLKELNVDLKPSNTENPQRPFQANFRTGEHYEMSGNVIEPIILNMGYGLKGFLEVSMVEFTVRDKKGIGIVFSGEIYDVPKPNFNPVPALSLPQNVPLTVKFTDEISHFGEISGGKGSSLGKLTQLSKEEKTFIVPKGIIVTTSAYKEFLTPEILEAVKNLENIAYGNENGNLKEACNEVSNIVEKAQLPNQICQSIIKDIFDIFGDDVKQHKFAVRSSATGEDTAAMSAAGQMDTFLGVQGILEIFTSVKKCWASQFGFIAIEYKRRNGQILNSPMAVVIQEMVACEVSGVLFTCDPVTNNPSVITITANYGLGETVVSGSVEPDTFKLRRKGNEEIEFDSVIVGAKHQKIVMQDSGGTITEDLDESSRKESCLSKETAEKLGKLSLKIESFYKSSRDIEWGIFKYQIYILQSRPVTNIAPETDYEMKHEFDIPLRCETEYFSVANVGEVMPGASSPLGIDCLTKYFNNFFKMHAVTKGIKKRNNFLIEKYHLNGPVPFMNHMMLKVIEIISPNGIDSQISKGFMISMFGRILKDPEMLSYGRERFKKGMKPPLKAKLRFYWDLITHDFKIEKVKKKIDTYHLDFLTKKTAKETFTAIVRSCSDFDESALTHVDCLTSSSIWNMIMFSILSNAKGDLDNDVYGDFAKLLATSSDVESANIPQAMQEVADQIAKDIDCEEFKSMSLERAEKWLQTSTSLAGYKFRQFLKRHGHRCLKEFDVRTITWEMNPKMLVKLLQNLVGVNKENKKKEEESISEIISGLQVPLGFISKCLLKFVLLQCRRGVRGREAGKSIMVKSLHHWRKGCRHLGKLMASEGYLPDEELMFFLTINEIDDLLHTRSPSIISRANYRRKIFPILEKYKFPEIMKGNPKPINDEDESIDSARLDSDLIMTGIPVSQGVIKGYARVAMTLEEAEHLKPGEILITYSTDIGWSPYFPIISGVVTELGGLISHGAVVSREYGLPCVVGLQGATKKFQTGDYVLLDGKKGILQRLPQPEK